MSNSENTHALEERVLRYLYEDLDEPERAEFEKELSTNRQLQALLERERELERAIPRGTGVHIDTERLEESHRQMRRNLQKQVANRSVIGEFLATLIRKPSLVALQSAALAASYVLGVLIASPSGDQAAGTGPMAGLISPLNLVGEQDYEISDMQIDRFDPVSGDIELSFSLASDSRLSGNVADTGIRTLMTVALLNEIDEAARLDTIEALQAAAYSEDISTSMIYVLSNDNNPGVRYSAVQSLVNYVEDEQVQSALRDALRQDVNPGVRVEAFNALARNPDRETLAVFRQVALDDSNEYIRERAQTILEGPDTDSDSIDFF